MNFNGKHDWQKQEGESLKFICNKCKKNISYQTPEKYESKGNDCANCYATEDVYPGKVVFIPAWWRENKYTQCRIQYVHDNKYITVKPLEGNPHFRMVKRTLIKSKLQE